MKEYKKLEEYNSRLSSISDALSILYWDSATMMPIKSGEFRNKQIEELSKFYHELTTCKQYEELIVNAENKLNELNDWQKANVRETRKLYDISTCIDNELAGKMVKAGCECDLVWREAKPKGDFKAVKPYLEEIVNLTKEIASIKAEKFKVTKYEALLISYDYGRKEEEINKLFSNLKQFLPSFTDEIIEKQKRENNNYSKIKLSKEHQKQINLEIMKDLGFNIENGRVDESIHPFCGGTYGDIRITTNYDENDCLKSIMATVHETGHAIYEQNRPYEYYNQPVGNSLGMSIHESQSLFYEMQIGTNKDFLSYLSKKIKSIANVDVSEKDLWNNSNKVEKSFIRIYADEVTYPLHVILRYELEQEILRGDVQVKDLPEAWNAKMKQYLNITPPSDDLGCLQDMHWYGGHFGYFPCYSLGAMIAAQWFDAAKPHIDTNQFRNGNFSSAKIWLNNNVHKYGSFYSASGLIEKVTGKNLDPEIYINYLKNKFK
ncbi:MAG: carboxypeptidase M32 [Sphingobacteriia bacterium]|nr:carboxypeptidase M32 [Sphingobacteriia bacterium]